MNLSGLPDVRILKKLDKLLDEIGKVGQFGLLIREERHSHICIFTQAPESQTCHVFESPLILLKIRPLLALRDSFNCHSRKHVKDIYRLRIFNVL